MSDRDPFADDVLGRLIASNHEYQREHSHYIVPLSERLLDTRAALAARDAELAAARVALEAAKNAIDPRIYRNVHRKVVTTLAALAASPAAEEPSA